MKDAGPSIQWLTHRLSGTPSDFLKTPFLKIQNSLKGEVDTAAVVSDLLFHISGCYLEKYQVNSFHLPFGEDNKNFLNIVLISCYLYYDSWFMGKKEFAPKILELFGKKLMQLAKIVPAEKFVSDPERREELARLCLFALELTPEGEKKTTALDRLATLDSVERERLIEQTRQAQERARKLREEIARREAEEAASKMSRE